jgi:hypothetical protein
LPSALVGVGHPEKALADVRAAEARSRKIDRPDGVTDSFHVTVYKIEPCARARNLFTKHCCRAALVDETEPVRPQMAGVAKTAAGSGEAEGLARTRAGPDRAIVFPAGAAQGVRPNADTGEEVALSKAI